MINELAYLFQRPEKGWDPVPGEYARQYAEEAWENFDPAVLDRLERWIGPFSGLRVLDLGGGPGQYSVALAKRGAVVTWHDISARYRAIAERHAAEEGVSITFSLGYLEEAAKFIGDPFDLVFCRICWYYCMNDRRFARLVYRLVRPGGAAYIDTNNERFASAKGWRRLTYWLNRKLGWKIGHPYPPPGLVAALLQKYDIEMMILDYTSPVNDRIFFRRRHP